METTRLKFYSLLLLPGSFRWITSSKPRKNINEVSGDFPSLLLHLILIPHKQAKDIFQRRNLKSMNSHEFLPSV